MPMKKTRDERSRRVSVATRRYIGRRIVWKVTRRKHPQDRGSRLTGNGKRRRALSKRQMLQEVAAATAGLAGCDENGKEIKFCLGLKSGCNRRRGNRRWWYSFLQNWDDPLQCRWGFVFRPVVSSWRQDNQFSVGNLGIVFFPTLLHWFEEFLFSTVCFSGCLSLFLFCASCRSTVAGKRGGIFARLYTIRTGGEWKGWISWMSVVMTANLVIGCSDWSWTALYLDTQWSVHQDGAQLRNNWIHDNRLPTGDGWYAGTWYGWNRDRVLRLLLGLRYSYMSGGWCQNAERRLFIVRQWRSEPFRKSSCRTRSIDVVQSGRTAITLVNSTRFYLIGVQLAATLRLAVQFRLSSHGSARWRKSRRHWDETKSTISRIDFQHVYFFSHPVVFSTAAECCRHSSSSRCKE